jgi:hypothetical protein
VRCNVLADAQLEISTQEIPACFRRGFNPNGHAPHGTMAAPAPPKRVAPPKLAKKSSIGESSVSDFQVSANMSNAKAIVFIYTSFGESLE